MSAIVAPSRIVAVEVYERGARVERQARVELPTAACEVVIGDLSRLAEPGSFRAQTSDGRAILSVHARLVVPPPAAGASDADGPLERERATAERAFVAAQALRHASHDRRAALVDMSWRYRGGERAAAADAVAAVAVAAELSARLDESLVALDDELAMLGRRLEAARTAVAQASASERLGATPTRELVVRLAAGAAGAVTIELSYITGAARWWPTYEVRVDPAAASVELVIGAAIVQATDEDWSSVTLALTTADLVRDARLPELESLRMGRAQTVAKKKWRPAPGDLDAMFEGFDAALAAAPRPPPAPRRSQRATEVDFEAPMPPPAPPAAALWRAERRNPASEGAGRGGAATVDEVVSYGVANEPATIMRDMALPAMRVRAAPAPAAPGAMATGMAMAQKRVAPPPPPELAEELADGWLDFDGLELAGTEHEGVRGARGRLRRAGDETEPLRREAGARVERVMGPPGTVDPRSSRGHYDHRYLAGARVDVPGDACVHRVVVGSASGPGRTRFVSVPREGAEVFREIVFASPFAVPLLTGPVDVRIGGALVTTSRIDHVPARGTLHLGLGVEERMRVARNVRVGEHVAGLLGGATVVEHHIEVSVRSSLGVPVDVELYERMPVPALTAAEDLEVAQLGPMRGEPYDQHDRADGEKLRGGLKFRAQVPAGGETKVAWGYKVKLPAKLEVTGGNRRE